MAGRLKPYTHYHKDGSVWAKGQMRDGVMAGYWEWFRKGSGLIMRSGSFDEKGQQTGEWTTYDQKGKVFKVTQMKPKAPKPKAKPAPKSTKKPAAKPKRRVKKAS